MKNQEEIADDEDRIDRQFEYKRLQALGGMLFHLADCWRVESLLVNVSNDLTDRRQVAVASNRLPAQNILHAERFFLTLGFTFLAKDYG